MKRTNIIARWVAPLVAACASLAAMAEVKFAPVDPTWSVPLILTTNSTAGVYCPVSVIAKSSSGVTFACGVTNDATSSATVPAISLKVKDSGGTVVKTYSFSSGKSVPGRSCIWVGGYAPSGLTSLAAGNYALEATLGAETRQFRFAIRDTARSVADAFTGAWSSITTKSGNDFASPPFAAGSAEAGFGSGDVATVQFGPYAPMDGIIEYKPGSDKGSLDLIFLIDLTGSMGGCITGLKNNITTFFTSLVNGDADHEPITNWRAKVVGYRDYFDDYGSSYYPWYEDHEWTSDVDTLISQISACVASGGGDGPESLLDAVWNITHTTGFREDASRVVLAFTDIGYKGTGLYSPYQDDWSKGSSNVQYGTGSTLLSNSTYLEYLRGVAKEAGDSATENELTVKVIASASDSYYHFTWLTDYCYPTNSSFTQVSSLSSFTTDADALRGLAGSVSASVRAADVVEPLLSAKITGPGILSYEWRNVSSADTNNTFTFKVSGLSDSYDTCDAATSGAWTKKTYELDEGTYTCQWFYKKLGYDGNLLDFGQVRRIEWIVATAAPTVTATDGTQSGNVTVTWSMPSDALKVKSYEVSRSEKGATAKTVLGSVMTTSYVDSSAVPGVDYTYYVRALNDAGFGEYGSDNGWRGVTLTLSPTSLSFGYAGETKSVTVGSNASWTIAATSGSLTATALTGSINVTADKNTALSSRTGSVTVRAGTTAHNVTRTVSVSQAKRPANLVKLEIVGGERTLEGGEGTTFTAVATFEDGTTNVVTTAAGWSITSGSKYGTIGAHTGVLATNPTTDTDGRLTVHATYTYAGSETVTKTAEVEVQIGFTKALLKPVSVVINGDDAIAVGETKPYRALVIYNDKTVEERTLSASALWSVTPASPKATVEKGSVAAMLSAYTGGITLSLQVAYTEAGATVSASKAVTVPAPITIPVAVDVEDPSGAKLYPLEFTTATSGTANVWYGQAAVSHDGTDAARSGRIFGAGTNSISTTVNEAGTLSFWWKVSSESIYDKFTFYVDGAPKAAISGTTGDWREMTFPVSAGPHTFTWEYAKDAKNDEGLDAAFVDMVRWVKLTPPAAPAVTASDGTDDTAVDIRWTKPDSSREILGYRVERSRPDGSARVVLAEDIVTTGWTDATAEPGLDYIYYVCAKNEAGYGEYGSDAGWRGVSLKVEPSELAFSGRGGESALSVESNAPWEIAAGDTWLTATATGAATAKVVAGENPSLDARDGTVAVTAAGATDHPKSIDISVTEAGRPPKIDVGFVAPYQNWRTKMQIAPADTEDEAYTYNPVSVFLSSDNLEISFGWTNKSEVAIGVPAIRFKLFRPGEAGDECIYEWTDGCKGARILKYHTPLTELPTGAAAWSGTLAADILKVLSPGDYMIEAEIGVDADDIDMSDNFAVFRFAVRDPALTQKDVLDDEHFSSVDFLWGNDFAQPPHIANRPDKEGLIAPAVQFGPYVPMNGFNGRISSDKAPLDIVFLVDFTGSMGGCINGLKRNIQEFFKTLVEGDKDHAPISDWRARVVGFQDETCDSNWYWDHDFTTDREALNSQINELYADNGGDWPESLLDALWRISKETAETKKFREDATRVVVAFTDAPYKTPMTYPGKHGSSDRTAVDAGKAAAEAGIILKLIASYNNESHFNALVSNCFSTNSTFTYTRSLSSFTGDAEALRGLAKTVSSVVTEAEVVEPMLSFSTTGRGTLSFDWINDSTADTNNTFQFTCDTVTNILNAAGSGWQSFSAEFEGGWHTFKWTYGKREYDGAVTDCGVLANVRWEQYEPQLEIAPEPMYVEYDGKPEKDAYVFTNRVERVDDMGIVTNVEETCCAKFSVKSDTVWKVKECDDWIKIVRGVGDGDGDLIVSADENMEYDRRIGFITVTAGEYGLATDVTKDVTVRVIQEKHPYVETDSVQILRVDVKPRWPWNELVDIDFLVVQPKDKMPGEKILVSLVGINEEGGDLINDYGILKDLRECAPRDGNLIATNSTTVVTRTGETNLIWPSGFIYSNDTVYAVCETTGVHRITWKSLGADWRVKEDALFKSLKDKYGNALPSTEKPFRGKDNGFHTPSFAVRLTAQCRGKAESFTSNPVRVDTRVGKSAEQSTSSWSGGAIIFGTEMVGHPDGAVDPVPYDSTTNDNGWVSLDFVEKLPEVWSNCTTKLCVLNNNNVFIEGGTITNSQTWKSGEVHVVRDNVFVDPAKGYLTIEDGAIVKFCFATTIYVHDNESDDYLNRHNILVKGAHFCSAYDQTYGSNTLYSAHSTAESDGGANWVRSEGYSDEVFYGKETWQKSRYHKAILQIKLKTTVKDPETGVVSTSDVFKERYYSRGQEFGNLPRISRPGTRFYGWYSQSPAGSTLFKQTLEASEYTAKKVAEYGIASTNIAYSTNNSIAAKRGADNKYIYGLLCPTNWCDTVLCEKVNVEGSGVATIYPETVVYDGKAHMADITVRMSDEIVDSENYAVEVAGAPCVNAGSYPITLEFSKDYSGVLEKVFVIEPRSTAGVVVQFKVDGTVANSAMYMPAGLKEPSVSVSDPEMGIIPASDYTGKWLDVNWKTKVGPGRYHYEVKFGSNFTGPAITNEFTVTVNPDYVYKEYGSEREAKTEIWKTPRTHDGTHERRILYIGGNDMMTEYVKNVIKSDIELNDYIVDNFICWADTDVTSDAFKRYSEGLDYVAPPVIAVLSKRDTSRYIDRISGYVTAGKLLAFLEDALAAPEDASSATLTLEKTEYTWTGTTISPPDGTVKVKFAGDEIDASNYSLVYSSGTRTDVGEYTVKAVFEGSLYSGETEEVAFRIVPAALVAGDITLTPASASVVYNGEYQRPEVTVAGGIDYTVSWGAGDWTKAGTYSLTVTASGNHTGSVTKNFTIAKAVVSGAVIELDSGYLEVSEDKMPSSPVKPAMLSVHDAARTYLEGTDYTIDWGDDEGYMTAGTNIITATFKGNYSGTATTNFIIEVMVKAATPEFDPASGTGVEVDAANAGEATSKVVIAVPSAVAAYVDAATYQTYFKKTATKDPTTGKWIVTAEIDKAVVLPATMTIGAKTALLEEHIIDAVLGTSEEPVFAAVPGMWYTLLGSATPSFGVSTGTPRLATGDSVALPKPNIPGPKAFFKLRVKATEE